MKEKPQSSVPQCPVGEKSCPVIADVMTLRQDLEKLSAQVRTDTLTGLANYRYFSMALAQEFERTQRSEQPTSLIMLDIDHFKKVNDTWGHEIGNQALIHVARLIVQSVRKLDIPCRYGGEEFAVILPDTRLRASVPVAERIRELIQTTPLTLHEKHQLNMTASLGIATYLNNQSITAEELIHQADSFLYQAKQNGRNQVCHAELPALDAVSQEEKKVLSDLFSPRSHNRKSS